MYIDFVLNIKVTIHTIYFNASALVIILDHSRYTLDAYTTYTPDASTAHSMDASGAQRSDGLPVQMTGRTGGGLRHRRKEKRGVAYNRYDPVSNGTQWQGMVYLVEYIMEYNRGASAIGVKSNFFFKKYLRFCKNFVILRNEREHSRVPVIGLPVRRTVRRT